MEYDNTNRGVLFRNDKKQTEKQPDFRGEINIEGEDRWLSAWVKESKEGKKYFSISSQRKEGEPSKSGAKPRQAETVEFAEDIPF